jgi:GC-rich sequence DNA-binding factor
MLHDIACAQAGAFLDLEADPSSSSSSSSTAEADAVKQYKRRRLEVLDLAPTVFADTDEQYASLTAVKARLEGFKAQYPREYSQAYIGESAAALFAPYVRLELLQWEPMPVGSSDEQQQQQQPANGSSGGQQQQQVVPFDTQEWYQQLFEFGLGVGTAAAGAEDADANLVPQLVESLVLPMALTLVAK